MKEIIINNKATIKANGIRTSGNCKPVICIDTGKVYASCYDAAEAVGVHFTSMSMVCRGKTKSCKGKRYCYIENVNEHLEEMTSNIAKLSAMEEKARMWDEYQAEQERIEKARREHAAKITKLNDKLARRNRIVEKLEAELAQAIAYRDEAANALREANEEEVA